MKGVAVCVNADHSIHQVVELPSIITAQNAASHCAVAVATGNKGEG
ncbi:hypothetical protein [Lonsdalea quercina]|nr:hypothetical protein [Lonsdalea quercina]